MKSTAAAPADRLRSYPVLRARACGLLLHLAVSSYCYQPHGQRDERSMRSALRRHAAVRRRWCYRRLLVLLRQESVVDNHKRIYWLCRDEGLQMGQRRRIEQKLVHGTERPVAPLRPTKARASTSSMTG